MADENPFDPILNIMKETGEKVALADKAGMDTKISFQPSGKALLIYFIPGIAITLIAAFMNMDDTGRYQTRNDVFNEWIGYGLGWMAILAIPAYICLILIRYNRKVSMTKEDLQKEVLRKGYQTKQFADDQKLNERLNRKKDDEF